jgi:hypothetical protein
LTFAAQDLDSVFSMKKEKMKMNETLFKNFLKFFYFFCTYKKKKKEKKIKKGMQEKNFGFFYYYFFYYVCVYMGGLRRNFARLRRANAARYARCNEPARFARRL